MKKILVIASLVMAIAGGRAFAQSESSRTPEQVKDVPTDVPSSVSDVAIQKRISNILKASEWFPETRVRVSEGLVFFEGKISTAEKSEWAENIAKNTQGVVAVVNNAEVELSGDVFSPAQNEVRAIVSKGQKLVPYVISALIILILFVLFAFFARRGIRFLMTKRNANQLFIEAITTLSSIAILIVGIYLALRASGLSGLAFTLVGGTGAIGLGIGLALKSNVENYIAGLIISMKGIFKRGEIVQVAGFEGVVQAVSTRGTTLMDFEGNNIIIPNADVMNAAIKNVTRNSKMRSSFIVGIGYENSIDRAQAVIMELLAQLEPKVLLDPKPFVGVDALGASSVNMKVYFWFDATKYAHPKVRSFVMKKVKERLMDEKISMPDDAREVIFSSPLEVIQTDQNKVSSPLVSQQLAAEKEKSRNHSHSPKTNHVDELEDDADELKAHALQSKILEGQEENLLQDQ